MVPYLGSLSALANLGESEPPRARKNVTPDFTVHLHCGICVLVPRDRVARDSSNANIADLFTTRQLCPSKLHLCRSKRTAGGPQLSVSRNLYGWT